MVKVDPFSYLAFHFDHTIVIFNDLVNNRQA